MVSRSVVATMPPSMESRPFHIARESLASLEKRQHSQNPKDHDLSAIIESVIRFGFTSPVMVDDATNTLVAGHGRVQALRAMRNDGYDPPDGVEEDFGEDEQSRDWLVPVIRGVSFKSAHDRDAYLIADNNLVLRGGWDTAALTDMLESLAKQDAEHGLDGTGYDMDDLETLLADKNYEPPPAPPPQGLETQFGVWLRVPDKLSENALCDLLEKYGYEKFRRMSEDG